MVNLGKHGVPLALSQLNPHRGTLSAAALAALTIYNMYKVADKSMVIRDIHIFEKTPKPDLA